jgi:hypothetical protein
MISVFIVGMGGKSDYLFGQVELEAANKTDGKMCYPICKPCLEKEKTVITYPRRNLTNLRRGNREMRTKLLPLLPRKQRRGRRCKLDF